MAPLNTAEIGKTGLSVTSLGLGGAPLGGNVAAVTEEIALRTIGAALDLVWLYQAYRVAAVHARYDGGVGPPYREAHPNRVDDFRYILYDDNSHWPLHASLLSDLTRVKRQAPPAGYKDDPRANPAPEYYLNAADAT